MLISRGTKKDENVATLRFLEDDFCEGCAIHRDGSFLDCHTDSVRDLLEGEERIIQTIRRSPPGPEFDVRTRVSIRNQRQRKKCGGLSEQVEP